MSFSFGGSGFGPSPAGSGLSFGFTGAPGGMQSGLSVDEVQKATGSFAGILANVRKGYDAIKGNTPSGTDALQYSGDKNYERPTGTQQATGSFASVLNNILGTLKETGEAAVRGALEGAQSTSAGARTGASVGASAANMNTTLLLGAGLALVFILRK